MELKNAYEAWESINLVYRILGGILVGLVLALLIPGIDYISLIGSLFISALKSIAPFLVLFLVIWSLCKPGKALGKNFKLVIFLYIISTIVAAVIACLISFWHPAYITLDTSGFTSDSTASGYELVSGILGNIVCNPITALTGGNYLGILFWAILIGMGLKALASENTINFVSDISGVVLKIVKLIISFAPFGVMGLIYDAVSNNGMEIFTEYGTLILLLFISVALVMFVTNPILTYIITRRNPFPLLFACLKGSAITAFFTRSSAANIPVNMSLCEKLGLDRDFYSTSIPLGATINMNGAAITINVMTLAAAFSLGVEVNIATAILLCIVSSFAAAGASGVGGGSLFLIPLACSLIGIGDSISSQLIAIGFIIGVIQDSMETALNSSADVMFTAAAEMHCNPDLELNYKI